MTKLNSLSASFLLALLVGSPAQAQIMIDVSKITCDQFRNQLENPVALGIWLSGYYGG
jgi:hypothetical protein